jgi:hypothetical protein
MSAGVYFGTGTSYPVRPQREQFFLAGQACRGFKDAGAAGLTSRVAAFVDQCMNECDERAWKTIRSGYYIDVKVDDVVTQRVAQAAYLGSWVASVRGFRIPFRFQ